MTSFSTGHVRDIHRGRRARLSWPTLTALVLSCGCGVNEHADLQTGATGGASPARGESGRTLVLSHDFGVVAPGSELHHVFETDNPLGHPLTFAELQSSCGCMAGNPSAQSIAPGASETIKVSLNTPTSSGDVSQRVTVSFREPDSPVLYLVLRAQVREPLTIRPRQTLELFVVGDGPGYGQVEVDNFSGREWQGLSVIPEDSWLQAEVVPLGIQIGDDVRWQSWRVGVYGDRDAAHTGLNSATIRLSSVGVESAAPASAPAAETDEDAYSYSNLLSVNWYIPEPVRYSPSEFFFGETAVGQSSQAQLAFTFARSPTESELESVTCTHDVEGVDMRFRWERISEERWKLVGELAGSGAPRFLAGKVTVGLSDEFGGPVSIPLRASIY